MFADTMGKYRFEGLPPGDYRVLSTFDYQNVDLGRDNGAKIEVTEDRFASGQRREISASRSLARMGFET